ncbi:S-layer homology domain-containing protein [Muriventricola aceti]|uniref:S-layer homology domain-containing protein n=1 Tax=Muriventricola aceti TaxID=2981773 RepID=UPI001DAD0077|nr:S-layer homology domain-containing protein [Clostridiales bacterium]
MEKRILASLMTLCLIVGLLPTAVLAVEEPGNAPPQACTFKTRCAEDTVDETCPVYAADYTVCTYEAPTGPEESTAKEKVCGNFSGCVDGTHDPECPLYTAPAEPSTPVLGVISPEIPKEIQAFLDAVEALNPEQPDTVEAAWTTYEALTGEQKAREDVAKGYEALLDAERQNAVIFAPVAAKAVYVSDSGDDDKNDGSQTKPYATLAEAVKKAEDGATIYVMSNLTMTTCARFYNKSLTITSGEGGPYTLTRGENFETIQDNARSTYNPAIIEVQANSGNAPYGLTLENIVLNDGGKHEGTVFAQAISGSSNSGNTKYAQDAIVSSNATIPCTITLGEGAVLQNFGGMSAVRVTDSAKLVMLSGSVIEDTTVEDRERGATGSNGPAGAVWIQGAEFIMENGAEVKNVVGRAVYADGGTASIGGTISGIAGDKDMWQGASGVAIHVRGGANVTLTGVVVDITAPSLDNTAIEAISSDFEAADGSAISQITNMMAVYAHDQGNDYRHKMLLNGAITDCVTTGSLMRSFYANIMVGPTGVIEKCKATGAGGLLYTHNGSQYTIQGKIIDNTASSVMYLGNWGGGVTYATLEAGGLIANNSSTGVQINGANSGAYFLMNGGEISGNGTGVSMREKATNHFIMNGGKIINNRSAGISHTFGNKTYIQLNGGEISGNGGNYEISASSGSANDSKNYLLLKKDVLKGNRCINLAFGRVTLDEDHADISLGKASADAANKIKGDVASEKGADWKNQSYSALWFKPTTESFHFTMPRPDVDNILYAGYIPLQADGAPATDAQLTLIQMEGNDATGSVTTTDTLDVNLSNLTPNQPYALMLIKSPILIVRPVDLAKYVTGDDKHDGESYVNCFPDPRYEGIPENASITVAGQPWDPGAHGGAQYPFTINYYEQDGAQIKDDHAPGTYIAKVEILPGLSVRPADILINGQRMYFGTGTLSIRAASNATEIENIEEISSQVTTDEPSQSVDQAVAVMPDNVNYLVNGITGQVPNPGADIRLLQDEVLSAGGDDEDQYVRMMRERLEVVQPGLAVKPGETPRQYAMKYLDLIDAHDSNLIVTPNLKYGQSYDLYIPYPTGTDENYEFQMFCFDDLDRTYTEKDYGANVENVIESSKVSELEVTPTEFGLKVTIGHNGRLGAMALTWQQSEHTITATAGTGGSISPSGAVGVRHTGEETFTITPDSGYNIADVEVDGFSQGAVNTYTFTNVTGDHTINATFKAVGTIDPTPGGGDHDDDYTLYYHSNFGSDKRFYQAQSSSTMKVRDYGDMKQLPARAGYEFLCWNTEKDGSGKDYDPGDTYRVSASSSHLYAQWVKTAVTPDDTGVSRWLNTHDHMAYLSGYADGNFGPDDNMTRAQVAQMFYRLLLEKDVPVTVQFSDVPADAWYATAVNTLASLDIVNGIGDHQFAPERQITRAEFTVIAMRFGRQDTIGSNIFTDVKADDWFYDQVVGAIKYGWIGGYEDGTFQPNNTITRAEVTVIVNRMLGRAADTDFVAAHADELRKFSDVPASCWAYEQIMEATNAHEYRSSSGREKWTGLVD